MQRKVGIQGDELSIPLAQWRAPASSIAQIAAKHSDRDRAIAVAYSTGVYSYREIGQHFGLHIATVGRIVREQIQ